MKSRPAIPFTTGARVVLGVVFTSLLAAATTMTSSTANTLRASAAGLTVRITSPLGRLSSPTAVRIVAQIRTDEGRSVKEVRFFVDSALLKTLTDGPPYAVEWVDANPFEKREIIVEAEDDLGEVSRDTVVLPPFEVTEATQVTSVRLDTAVYDKKGHFVTGLDGNSFYVSEDGVPQQIDMVASEAIPATFALLVDSSQSMSRRMEFVREAAGRVASYLRPMDSVIVAPFSKTIAATTGPTNDRATVMEAITAIQAAGGTAIADSLVEMAGRLATVKGRAVVVLITDGYDENSTNHAEDAIRALKAASVTTYVVGIGGVAGISLKGEQFLKDLATETGGRAFFPPRMEDLVSVYDTLTVDAQNRYLITYTPTNQAWDGTWRTVALTTFSPEHVIQTKKGYFARKPPPIQPSFEFTVMDLKSQYLEISRDDLIVLENGVEQKIETFQEAVNPVSIVLALDSSGSMKPNSEQVVAAARSFVDAVRSEDSLGVFVFADASVLAHGLDKDHSTILDTIDHYHAEGGTALFDALCDSFSLLRGVTGRRAVVVLTDGRDEDNPGTGPGSLRSYDEVLKLLRQTEVTVFAVGLGPRIETDRLRQLADMSGGYAYFPSDVSTLREQYARVLENLRRRYVLSYTSTNVQHDGKWRTVEIRAKAEGVRVTSRNGYFAPDR
jgi:Ca-activated chloride channel family protein